jgi:hypothetical protein
MNTYDFSVNHSGQDRDLVARLVTQLQFDDGASETPAQTATVNPVERTEDPLWLAQVDAWTQWWGSADEWARLSSAVQ